MNSIISKIHNYNSTIKSALKEHFLNVFNETESDFFFFGADTIHVYNLTTCRDGSAQNALQNVYSRNALWDRNKMADSK